MRNAPVFLRLFRLIRATALFDKVSEDIQDRGIAWSHLLQGPSLGDVGNPAILLVRSAFWWICRIYSAVFAFAYGLIKRL